MKRIALLPCIHRARIWPTLLERIIPELVAPLCRDFEVHVVLLNAQSQGNETILASMPNVIISHLDIRFRDYDDITGKLSAYAENNDISIFTNVMGGGLYVGWILNQVKQRTGVKTALRISGDEIRARSIIQGDAYLGSSLAHSHSMIAQANAEGCDALIVMCEDEAERVRIQCGNGDKIHVIPRGVDVEQFPFTDRSRSRGSLYVSFVGRPSSEKGFDIFCKVAAALKHERFDFTFAGFEAERALPPNVRYAGYLDQNEVAQHLSQTDILFLPSKTDALPQSLLEAAATGCVGLIPQHLLERDFKQGVIRSSLAVDDLVDKLRQISDARSTLADLARQGREVIEDKFSHRRCGASRLDFFRKLSRAA